MRPENMVGAAVMKQNGPEGKYVRISFAQVEFPFADQITDLFDTLEEAMAAPYVMALDDSTQIHQNIDWTVCKNLLRDGVIGDRTKEQI